MNAIPRPQIAFLAMLSVVLTARGGEALPSIFAAPPPLVSGETIPAAAPVRPVAAISETTRKHIGDAVMTDVREASLAAAAGQAILTAPESAPTTDSGDAVPMARYIVRGKQEPELTLAPSKNQVLEKIQTGRLYHHVGRNVTTDLNLLGSPTKSGHGRIALSFSISW